MVATLLSIFSSFCAKMTEKERTFLMLKPDAVERGLVGEVINRFQKRGFKLVAMKFMKAPRGLLEKHYAEHKGKGFFDGLVTFMGSGPLVPMVWEGKDVVKLSRAMIGETSPVTSNPGTIRGDYGIEVGRNLIHGSDAVETSTREIPIWFTKDELVTWTSSQDKFIYE